MEGLAWCRKEAQAYLREVQETVGSLPQQVGEVPGHTSPPLLGPPLATSPPQSLLCFR